MNHTQLRWWTSAFLYETRTWDVDQRLVKTMYERHKPVATNAGLVLYPKPEKVRWEDRSATNLKVLNVQFPTEVPVP